MKQCNSFRTIALLFAIVLFFNNCTKDTTSDLRYGIDPANQKSLLCKSLRLNGNNIDGVMHSNIGTGSPLVVAHPLAVEVSAGVLLFIPYQISNVNDVCQIYLQVEGADNYWEAALTIDPASNQPYFQILIPKFVLEGEFDFVFSLGDCNGNVSSTYSTQTTVSPVADCDLSISGSVGITVRSFDLGDKQGVVRMNYEMYSIKDRLDIRYNGNWVGSTGTLLSNQTILPSCGLDGFVSNTGYLEFKYDPKVNRFVEVYITGCEDGTAWDVWPVCP